jgi:hypothetical protein
VAHSHTRPNPTSRNLLAIVLQTEHRFLQILDLNRGLGLYMICLALRRRLDHNHIHRDRLCDPGSTEWPRFPVIDAVNVAELSVVQPPDPGGIRAFPLAVEPNTRSEIDEKRASKMIRVDIKLLAVFSHSETKLFFRIPILNRAKVPTAHVDLR